MSHPELIGLNDLLDELKRVSAFANTPVIILTGSDGLIDRVRAKVVGCTDFITKPVEADKVMGLVRKYLQPSSSAVKASYVQTLSLKHQ